MIWVHNREYREPFRTHAAATLFAAAAASLVLLPVSGYGPYERLACIPIVCGAAWFVGTPFAMLLAVVLGSANGLNLSAARTSGEIGIAFSWEVAARCFELATMAAIVALLRRSRAHAFKLARRDPLTGIANRQGFLERVEAELNRCRRAGLPVSVAYFDLDYFKEINDTCGHLAGDEILKTIAKTLEQSIRNYDCAARLGGDEFALLLAEADPANVRAAVERIRGQLHASLRRPDRTLSFSIGVASVRAPEITAEELVNTADRAMYDVKHATRNGVQYVVS